MILVDMNQISLASMMMHLHMSKSKEIDENMVRHMILNSLRMYRTKFSSEFGELVLCYDSKHYWRRDYFPEYKFSRRKSREKSTHDWNAIFSCLNEMPFCFNVVTNYTPLNKVVGGYTGIGLSVCLSVCLSVRAT